MSYTDDEKNVGLINIEEPQKVSNLDKWKTRLLHITIAISLILFFYLLFALNETRAFFKCHQGETVDPALYTSSQSDFKYLESVPTNIREYNDIKDVYSNLPNQLKDIASRLQNIKVTRNEQEVELPFDPEHVEYRDEDDYPHAHAIQLDLI